MAQLTAVHSFPAEAEKIRIGRGPEFDICLYDPKVSRSGHADILRREDGAYELQDLGSRNGTVVNGELVGGRHLLIDGDVIQCGGSVLVFQESDGPVGGSGLLRDVTQDASFSGKQLVELKSAYERILEELERTRAESERLRGRSGAGDALVGSLSKGKFADVLKRAAASERTTLIQGENGTGKELVALALHRLSPRAKGPFLTVNCAAISASMIESELFGHKKGSFTGAVEDRAGKFRATEGGTLFLDEIGDLSLEAQAKVLRAIENGEIQPVGMDEALKVDVRVVAATNKELKKEVADRRFRQDLYQRLRLIELRVPPLRERKEDIEVLAPHFLESLRQDMPSRVSGITREALRLMKDYSWPGNVRELRNAVERAVIFCDGEELSSEDFGDEIASGGAKPSGPQTENLTEAIEELEVRHIRAIYEQHGRNKRQTAAALGISRQTLDNKLAKYGIGEGVERET